MTDEDPTKGVSKAIAVISAIILIGFVLTVIVLILLGIIKVLIGWIL